MGHNPNYIAKTFTSIPFLGCKNSSQQTVLNEGLCIRILMILVHPGKCGTPKRFRFGSDVFPFQAKKRWVSGLQPLKFQGCSCSAGNEKDPHQYITVPKLKLGRRSFPIGKVTFQAHLLLNFQGCNLMSSWGVTLGISQTVDHKNPLRSAKPLLRNKCWLNQWWMVAPASFQRRAVGFREGKYFFLVPFEIQF